MSHSHRCVPINWCHMQWLTIGGPHYNSDFTDVYDYGILLLCVFREGIWGGGGFELELGFNSFFFIWKAPLNCLCRNWWRKWRVQTEQTGFVLSLSDLHCSMGVISCVVYQENRQLSRTKINRASLQLLGLRVKIKIFNGRWDHISWSLCFNRCVEFVDCGEEHWNSGYNGVWL